MKKKLVYLFIIFLISAFVGWIYELIFYYFTEGVISNRGVLFGPLLPIYGVGGVLIYYLKPLKKYPFVIFILSLIITFIVEYIGGYILDNYFKIKLWDYTGLFLSIDGYVCLRSILSFSVGAMIFHYLLEDKIYKVYNKMNEKSINILLIIITILLIIDIIYSLNYRVLITY